MPTSKFERARDRFLAWCAEDALPLFRDKGHDPLGGYFEALSHDGEPLRDGHKRLRVQARQAWSFARAEQLGLMTGGRDASDHAWRFMIDKGLRRLEGGPASFIHVFNRDGSVKSDRRDSYDHAFVLLASAERRLRYGDPEADEVDAVVEQFFESVRRAEGGFGEGIPSALPRRTNPHMHLFEASLLRRQAGPWAFSDGVVREIAGLWDRVFWDEKNKALLEFFDDDWNPHPDKGMTIEPGHMVEWLWLLHEGNHGHQSLLTTLFDAAREHGLSSEHAVLVDTVDLHTGERANGARLWGQTEHIRAAVVLARMTNEERYFELASELLENLHRHYLCSTVRGGWIDRLGCTGKPLSDRMPSSLLYHVLTLADELIERH